MDSTDARRGQLQRSEGYREKRERKPTGHRSPLLARGPLFFLNAPKRQRGRNGAGRLRDGHADEGGKKEKPSRETAYVQRTPQCEPRFRPWISTLTGVPQSL